MEKKYKIAGLIVQMDSFGRTITQAQPYSIITEQAPDIVIASNWVEKKQKYPHLSDSDGEYLATGFDFYKKLLNFEGFQLHSSAVVVDGKAYLFTADPGTGKSTHTGLWLRQFGERAFILNDDKPAVRREGDAWYAYGTPWSGKYDISVDTRVPVAGIAVVVRDPNNWIEPYSGKDAVVDILRQVNRPRDMQYRMMLLTLLDQLMTQVPIWKLHCNMDPEAAIVSYEAMSGKKWRK